MDREDPIMCPSLEAFSVWPLAVTTASDSPRYEHIIVVGDMDEKPPRIPNPLTDIEHSSWIRIFRAFDTDHDGLIEVEQMQKTIREATFSFGFDHYELQNMSLFLEMRQGAPINFQDFCYMVQNT
ncbi:unnamed protein product [Caenorhabditis auriculariae]|uniref:EF-hand domain-containing protein n=1 Tax=Caenorhabditis auriculariae TaxID=2777116 RepID=A0A8S1GZH3_9PELO|nr:unnamed protein product [Caenorhabditis auriculariae]